MNSGGYIPSRVVKSSRLPAKIATYLVSNWPATLRDISLGMVFFKIK